MGGTFDPIHHGHLILAEQAWQEFDLDKVLFVTAADPPHKPGRTAADVQHRHEMVGLAVESNGHFERSTIEIDRPGPSYTVDTIRHILAIYGSDTQVRLLVGADEARNLMAWRDPYEIQTLATIVIANRPGYEVRDTIGALPADFAKGLAVLDIPGVDISSTDVRERVRGGRSIRYLVPEAVEHYILRTGLYRGES